VQHNKVKFWIDIRSQAPLSKIRVDPNCGVEFGNGLGKMDKYGDNEEGMKQACR
jgi:hypothetical protein